MGNKPEKQTHKVGSENTNKINLVAKICSSWGYNGKAEKVKNFCNYLAKEGYNVTVDLVPVSGQVGIYDLIQITSDNNEVVLFSNNSKHNNAIINKNITESDYSDIKSKLY